jgi:predicted dehydrogenase
MEYITNDRVTRICADKTTFLPDRDLDEDVNVLLHLDGGGKGVLTISQIATGEENNLWIRVYASKGAIVWRQENPNYLEVYRYGEPRQTMTRASGYLSTAARDATRIPTGHPEGYLEAFATIYCGAVEAIRKHIDGNPLTADECNFPTVYDGLRGMQFIYKAVESSDNGSVWVDLVVA